LTALMSASSKLSTSHAVGFMHRSGESAHTVFGVVKGAVLNAEQYESTTNGGG